MNKLLLMLIISIFVSCNSTPTNKKKIGIDELFWLQGNWIYESKNGTMKPPNNQTIV